MLRDDASVDTSTLNVEGRDVLAACLLAIGTSRCSQPNRRGSQTFPQSTVGSQVFGVGLADDSTLASFTLHQAGNLVAR